MKKVLITFVLLLMAVGAFGQNTFRYVINANGGIAVTAPFSIGGITITSTGAQFNFLNTATSDIQVQLAGKAATAHTHTQANIEGLPDSLLNHFTKAQTNTRLNGKQDNPINYYPTIVTFGNATQQYDLSGTTWVSSTDGTPNAVGHLLPATLASMAIAYDNTYLSIREGTGAASATNPLTVQFTFPSVTTFNVIKFRTRYVGSASHDLVFELYNGSTWESFLSETTESAFQVHTAEVLVPATYIIGGTVTGRFRHEQTGNAAHYFTIDYIVIGSGGGSGGASVETAIQTPSTPSGGIAATNVQDALDELDNEKLNVSNPTATGTLTMPTPFTLGAISVTTTGTQLNYLNATTGTTGIGNIVLDGSPTISSPNLTGTTTTEALRVAGSATTQIGIDSIVYIDGKYAVFDGADTISPWINLTDEIDLFAAIDTSTIIATKYDLDTLTMVNSVVKADSMVFDGGYVTPRKFLVDSLAFVGSDIASYKDGDTLNHYIPYANRLNLGTDILLTADSTGNAIGNYVTHKALVDSMAIKINSSDSTGNISGNYMTRQNYHNDPSNSVSFKEMQGLGTTIKVLPMFSPVWIQNNMTLVDGQIDYLMFYIPEPVTITGVRFQQNTQGNYTGDNFNGFGLYSLNISNGVLTLVATTANDEAPFENANGTIVSVPFTGTYAATPGYYMVALCYNESAHTTVPILKGLGSNLILLNTSYPNSIKMTAYRAAQAALPTPTEASSNLISTTGCSYVVLY